MKKESNDLKHKCLELHVLSTVNAFQSFCKSFPGFNEPYYLCSFKCASVNSEQDKGRIAEVSFACGTLYTTIIVFLANRREGLLPTNIGLQLCHLLHCPCYSVYYDGQKDYISFKVRRDRTRKTSTLQIPKRIQ